MKATSAGVLEFEALRQLLGRYVSSPLGHAELERIRPRRRRAPGRGTGRSAGSDGVPALRGTPANGGTRRRDAAGFRRHPGPHGGRSQAEDRGASLEPREIFELLSLLDRAADAKSILAAVAERFPLLAAFGALIGDFRGLLRDLEGKILPDGTVADNASVLLGRLRRDIERQKKSIQESLERFLRATATKACCRRCSSPSATSASCVP